MSIEITRMIEAPPSTVVYHAVTPDERVSYPWYTSLGETTVDVRLRPADAGTELTLVHTGWGEGAADLRVGVPMGQKTPATV